MVAAEMREIEQLEKRPKLESAKSSESTRSVVSSSRTLMNGTIVDGLPEVDSSPMSNDDASKSHATKSGTFFDAEEAEAGSQLFSDPQTEVINGGSMRRGARCPIQGANLRKTGDQLYAPYLQRPQPLTDDVIAQRQMMLAHEEGPKASVTVLQRLAITQRLQKPKLLSDMQSFKAANPGAVFEDFIGWYAARRRAIVGRSTCFSLTPFALL